MLALTRYSEQFGPNGNLAGEGALNVLGRPPIDVLTSMIRESVQNSWDARLRADSLRYYVEAIPVDDSVRTFLQEVVFRDLPVTASPSDLLLARALGRPSLHLLALSDRGSVGLGGPTRADLITDPTTPRDFVDFLRNIGEPPDPTRPTGGTYGYGKAALYLASSAHALIVYTRSREPSGLETRLIGSAIGSRYIKPDGHFKGRYTGRHWWGSLQGEVAEPLINERADDVAKAIGLRRFHGDETGTTIVIVDPLAPMTVDPADSDSDTQAPFDMSSVVYLAEALLWYFWPKMLGAPDGNPAITFACAYGDVDVPIPDPADFPPLGAYVRAYRDAKAFAGVRDDNLRRVSAISRHSRRLGVLALRRSPWVSRAAMAGRRVEYPAPVGFPSSHVALMRQPELVVAYHAGPPIPTDDFEYGGVFIAEPTVDKAFARSEPPAHDAWVVESLDDAEQKGIVRVALRKISDEAADFARPRGTTVGETAADDIPLGEFSDEMSVLIADAEGGGAGPRDGSTGGRGTAPKARVVPSGPPEFRVIDGNTTVVVPFIIRHQPGSRGSRLRAQVSVALDDGTLEKPTDLPANANRPEIVGWIGPDGMLAPAGDMIVPIESVGTWMLVTSATADASVGATIEAEAVHGPA